MRLRTNVLFKKNGTKLSFCHLMDPSFLTNSGFPTQNFFSLRSLSEALGISAFIYMKLGNFQVNQSS